MKQLRDSRGLSLVEVLVALAVFSIVGVAISGLMVQGLQVRRENQLNTQAQAYASSVLESYKSHWANLENYETYVPGTKIGTLDPPEAFALELDLVDIDTECVDLEGEKWTEDACDPDTDGYEPPPLRQVTVKLTDQAGKVRADLVTEIGNPRP